MIEIMLGTSIMVIVLVALLGSFFGQSTLNQNSRNTMAAMNDATRVLEEIRRQNVTGSGSCVPPSPRPSARPPSQESWNEWFDQQPQGQGKSLDIAPALRNRYELVVVTCQEVGDQDGDGSSDEYCGSDQTGQREWRPWHQGIPPSGWPVQGGSTSFDPIRVTVAVGWSQRQPVGNIGGMNSGREFTYVRQLSGGGGCAGPAISSDQLRVGPDANVNRVIDSPAMLTTVVTCR